MPQDSQNRPRVLCVDDEPEVLEGLRSHLRKICRVATAGSGEEALAMLAEERDFAVVISDMRMPQMNGATLLARCRERLPEATRVLLTGYAEMDAAVEAVNDGHIFRFLTKPCPPPQLVAAVQAAIAQHQLVNAEKLLLHNTLNGAVRVLVEVLSLAVPAAFGRANLIKRYMRHMAAHLGLKKLWIYELAAMLAPIGCITLPAQSLGKALAGQALDEHEQAMFDAHPQTGAKLLSNISRLEHCAAIVRRQRDAEPHWPRDPESSAEGLVAVGGAMLRLAVALDERILRGGEPREVLEEMSESLSGYSPLLANAMLTFDWRAVRGEALQMVRVHNLQADMVLDEDVVTRQGGMVCRRDTPLNGALIAHIRNFADGIGVNDPVRVRIGH